ncbi:MAG: DUF4136 domain-containing protein [Acidobacteriota bacterium]
MNIFCASLLTVLMLWASFACGQSVRSSYDKDCNLSRLKTYNYKVEERDKADPLATDTLMDQKIRDALEDALRANFYHQSSSPDFLISYRVAAKDMTAERRALRARGNMRMENYVQGTLIVDFIDAETGKLIWRGVASGIVGRDMVDFKVAEEKIEAASRWLLDLFRKDIRGL